MASRALALAALVLAATTVGAEAQRAFAATMTMQKIDVATIDAARRS
jgi:predicted 3-demethylubiquinone-9 3-methyltransferase (glyoxalase superfamily)